MIDETKNQFATPSDVLKIVTNIEQSMLPRSCDRAMMDGQFNGGRPFSAEEEKEFQIQVNANFLEGYKIAQAAILQMNSALLYKERFFNARCLGGKAVKRREYSEKLTNNLHRPLKRKRSGKRFLYMMQNRNCALTLHGVGALWWQNDHAWMPKFVPLDDLLIPTDTPLEMSDGLGYFGVNSWLTPYQFWQMTMQDKSVGWNKEISKKVLSELNDITDYGPDYWDKPEKMEQLWKQRSAYLNSDAVPKVKITTFYNQDDHGKWYRKVIVRENSAVGISTPDQFIYENPKPYADSIDQILSIQFGDGSVVAPFKYRSVRGLAVLLFSIIELMNRLRCQLTASVFADLVPMLTIQSPANEGRPKMLQYQAYGVMPNGCSFVPKEQRHQPNYQLVETVMSEFRQLMSENSASYVQDIDTGSQKEMTLGEAQIRLQAVNKMVASMLMGAYEQEVFFYEETLRRFLSKTSNDPEVKQFQEKCRADGIPDALMNTESWQIDITRAFGAGDQTLAQQEVTSLMQIQQQLDPEAQRIVRRQYISTMTRNPDLANELVPIEPDTVTSGSKAAENVFGTLMQGVDVGLRQGIEQEEYIAKMMEMMQSVIQRIQGVDNVGSPQDITGLNTVSGDVQQHIDLLSEDPNSKEFVTAAGKALGKMQNEIKGFAQRLEEQQQKSQLDPEAMAKIENDRMMTEQKLSTQQATLENNLRQSQEKFALQMQQAVQKHELQMEQIMQQLNLDRLVELTKAKSETDSTQDKANAEVGAIKVKAAAEIASQGAKTAAEIKSMKEKAAAQPAAAAKE